MIRLVCETVDGPKKLALPFASDAPFSGLFDAVRESRREAGEDWSGLMLPRATYSLWLMEVDTSSKKLKPVRELTFNEKVSSLPVETARTAIFLLKARRSSSVSSENAIASSPQRPVSSSPPHSNSNVQSTPSQVQQSLANTGSSRTLVDALKSSPPSSPQPVPTASPSYLTPTRDLASTLRSSSSSAKMSIPAQTSGVFRDDDELEEAEAGGGNGRSHRDRLIALCAKYNPSSLVHVDSVLKSFQGREEELIQQTVRAYGPEPKATERSNIRDVSPEVVRSFVRVATVSSMQTAASARKSSGRRRSSRRSSSVTGFLGDIPSVQSGVYSSDGEDDDDDSGVAPLDQALSRSRSGRNAMASSSSSIRRIGSSVVQKGPAQLSAAQTLAADVGPNSPDLIPVHRQNFLRQLLATHGEFAPELLRREVNKSSVSLAPVSLALSFVAQALHITLQHKEARHQLEWEGLRIGRHHIEQLESSERYALIEKLWDPILWLFHFHQIVRLCFTRSALVIIHETIMPAYWRHAEMLTQRMQLEEEFIQRSSLMKSQRLTREALQREELSQRQESVFSGLVTKPERASFFSIQRLFACDRAMILRAASEREESNLRLFLRSTQMIMFETWTRQDRALAAHETLSRTHLICTAWRDFVLLPQLEHRSREALVRLELEVEALETVPRWSVENERYLSIVALSRHAIVHREWLGRRDIEYEVFHVARHATERRVLASIERVRRLPTEIRERIARRMLEHRRLFGLETLSRKATWRDERAAAKLQLLEAVDAVRLAVERVEAREWDALKAEREADYWGLWAKQLDDLEEPLARSSHFIAERFHFFRIQQFELLSREVVRWRLLGFDEQCNFINMRESFQRGRLLATSNLQMRVFFFKQWEQQRRILHRDTMQKRFFPLLKNATECDEEAARSLIKREFKVSALALQRRQLVADEELWRFEHIYYSEIQWFERLARRLLVYQWHISWHSLVMVKFVPQWNLAARQPIAHEQEIERIIWYEHITRRVIALDRGNMKYSFEAFFFFGAEIARRSEVGAEEKEGRLAIRRALKEILDANERRAVMQQFLAERLSVVPFHELDRWEAIGRLWIEEVLEPVAADILEQRQMMNDVLHERRGIFKQFFQSLLRLQVKELILEEGAERRALYNRSADAHYDRWNAFEQTHEHVNRRGISHLEANAMTKLLARYTRLLMMPFRRAEYRVENKERMEMAFAMLLEGEVLVRNKIRSNGLGVLVKKWTTINEFAKTDTERYQQVVERERKFHIAQKAAEERAAARRLEQQELRRIARLKLEFEQRHQELRNGETQGRFRLLEDERKVRIVMIMQLSFEISKVGGRLSSIIVPRLKHLQDEIAAVNLTHLLANRAAEPAAVRLTAAASSQRTATKWQPSVEYSSIVERFSPIVSNVLPTNAQATDGPGGQQLTAVRNVKTTSPSVASIPAVAEASSHQLGSIDGLLANHRIDDELSLKESNRSMSAPRSGHPSITTSLPPIVDAPEQHESPPPRQFAMASHSPQDAVPSSPTATVDSMTSPSRSPPAPKAAPAFVAPHPASLIAELLLESFSLVRTHVINEERAEWEGVVQQVLTERADAEVNNNSDKASSSAGDEHETEGVSSLPGDGDVDDDDQPPMTISDEIALCLDDEVCLRQDIAREAAKKFRQLCMAKSADIANMFLPFHKYEALANESRRESLAIETLEAQEVGKIWEMYRTDARGCVAAEGYRMLEKVVADGFEGLATMELALQIGATEIGTRECVLGEEALEFRLLGHRYAVSTGRILTSECDVLLSEETFCRAHILREEASARKKLTDDCDRRAVVLVLSGQERVSRQTLILSEQHHRSTSLRLFEAASRRLMLDLENERFTFWMLVSTFIQQEHDDRYMKVVSSEQIEFSGLIGSFSSPKKAADRKVLSTSSGVISPPRLWMRSGSGDESAGRRMAELLAEMRSFSLPAEEQSAREEICDEEEEAWLVLLEVLHEQRRRVNKPSAAGELERIFSSTRARNLVDLTAAALTRETMQSREKLYASEIRERDMLRSLSTVQVDEAAKRLLLIEAEYQELLQLQRKQKRTHPVAVYQRLLETPLREAYWRQVNASQDASRRAIERQERSNRESKHAEWVGLLQHAKRREQGLRDADAEEQKRMLSPSEGRKVGVTQDQAARKAPTSSEKILPPLKRQDPPEANKGKPGSLQPIVGAATPPQKMTKSAVLEQRRAQSVSPDPHPRPTPSSPPQGTGKLQPLQQLFPESRNPSSSLPPPSSSVHRLPTIVVAPYIKRQIVWGDDQPLRPKQSSK